MPGAATIVVPCFCEEGRLDRAAFLGFARAQPDLSLLFVDDGSTDGTAGLLASLALESGGRCAVLTLETNRGKAEAVRQGLRRALEGDADIVGYLDADLATPLDELARLLGLLREGRHQVILGSRVGLLGYDIQRKTSRHYLGRVFATAASLALRLRIYDTQCGAKLFRRTPALAAALRDPFVSRWAFDVELLGRLLIGSSEAPRLLPQAITEAPLLRWHDVAGSKLGMSDVLGMAREMLVVERDLSRRRAAR